MKNNKNKKKYGNFMDLQVRIDCHSGGSTVSENAQRNIGEDGALGMPKSKVPVPVELLVRIHRV